MTLRTPTSSIWRQPGMPSLIAMSFAGFSGFVVLLPVAPLWAVHGGATTAGSGLVNGVLLLFTVLTQLFIPGALLRFGWGPVLATGMALMGVPAALYYLSDTLGVVLALSAVRGVGFGVLTVTGSAAVAALVDARRRGEAIGAYGLAVALPNLVLLPAGPWIAENLGFGAVFALGALPLIGIPAAFRLAAALRAGVPHAHLAEDATRAEEPDSAAYRKLLRPTLLLLSVTLAGGAVITFTPQMVDSATLAAGGLLVMGLFAAASRWQAGVLADRYGAQRFLVPLVPLTGAGMAVTAWAVAGPDDARVALFLTAMVIVGVCYGALQNLTLVIAFDAVSRKHHNLASAVWNVGFDAGTALGSVAVGTIAGLTSFTTAFLVAAGLALSVFPLAVRRARRP